VTTDATRDERPIALFWWLLTATAALALFIVNVTVGYGFYGTSLAIAFFASAAQSGSLLLVLWRPAWAAVVQFAGVALFALGLPAGQSSTWPLTVTGLIALIVYIGLVALRTDWRNALATWWISVIVLVAAVLAGAGGHSVADGVPALILYPSNSALALLLALGIRYWRTVRRQLAGARRDVAVEQSQRALAEERTRIARELHDVVAHSMSVIHMQATSASYRLTNLDPEAKDEFARIAAGARSAMREMRQLLAVLRDEAADPQLAPVPSLDRLAELAEGARQAGVPVTVRAAAGLPVTETVGAAAYRIVQESLSNVIRHAPGAPTTVDLDVVGDRLEIVVRNERAATAPAEELDEPGRTGHGLHGMGERVRLLGGTLETGPAGDGGYQVAARLPIGGDA
jgi:signal transduction histidine kinase